MPVMTLEGVRDKAAKIIGQIEDGQIEDAKARILFAGLSLVLSCHKELHEQRMDDVRDVLDEIERSKADQPPA